MDDETQLHSHLIYLFLIHVNFADLLRFFPNVYAEMCVVKHWLQFLSSFYSDKISIYTEFCTAIRFIGERGGFISKKA